MVKYLLVVVSFAPMAIPAQNVTNISQVLSGFEENNTYQHLEKVYLHTDKSTYITGETLWFKAYLVDAATHTLNSLSKVLYVQLVDEAGQTLKQQRVRLINGKAAGQFFISPDITTAVHSLKAYTSWMRNWGNDCAYSKNITVINPAVPINAENYQATDTKIEFFPEGGEMVSGLPCNLGVKATNGYGLGEKLELIIMDQEQNEVTTINTSSLGFSSFVFTPEKGKTYYAQMATDSSARKFAFPEAKDSGITLMATDDGGDLVVTINATDNRSVFVVTHTRGVIKEYKSISIAGGPVEVYLNKGLLGEGISHITILDQNFSPIGERIVFKYPDTLDVLDISTDKTGYTQREKVTISLNGQGIQNASLSLSIYRHEGQLNNANNIVSDLLLTSDIKGYVENPTYYFEGDLLEKSKELENLLLTQGWRSFKWNDQEPVETNSFIPEINAPVVSGHVDGKGDLFYGFMGKRAFTNSIAVDSEGGFAFEVPFRLHNDRIIFWQDRDTLTSDRISIREQFIDWPESKIVSKSVDESIRAFAEHNNGNIQISHAYLDQTKVTGEINKIPEATTSFYGSPERTYNLDDYTRFIEMRELFVEYIRTAFIRRSNKQQNIYISWEEYPTTPALVLMDGIPVSTDFILGFDPLTVETVDIVRKNYQLGEQRFEGVINFITYKGDMAESDLSKGLVSKAYHALQAPREFYQPDYSLEVLKLQRTPDFRNTLLWRPNLTLENGQDIQVEFYTGDDSGEYRIEINGITSNGHPVYVESDFSVRSEPR